MAVSDENAPAAPLEHISTVATSAQEGARAGTTYRVGSLIYTRRMLLLLFLEMLGGIICFEMIDQVITKLLPVTLKDMQASNATIGLLASGLPMVLGMILVPIVGSHSDRFRSRFGRRVPFLLVLTPLVGLFLALVGQTDRLGSGLGAMLGLTSTATAAFAVVAIAAVLFQLFNTLVTTIFNYLVRDVVPGEVLGRFYGVTRMFAAAAGFLFNRYFLGWADANRGIAYGAVGGLYCAVYLLVCLRVKEGDYPPPATRPVGTGLRTGMTTYCRECFSHSFYVLFYMGQLLYTMSATCLHTFIIFFAKDLGMSLDAFGKAISWTLALGLLLYLPLGYVADRIHPMRLQIVSLLVLPIVSVLNFFLIDSETTFLVWTLLWWLGHLAYLMSNAPLVPLVLPAEKYGQFYSALYVLSLLGGFAGGYVGGQFLDLTGSYRYIYAWNAVLNSLTLAVMLPVYVMWKRLGGATSYRPPE